MSMQWCGSVKVELGYPCRWEVCRLEQLKFPGLKFTLHFELFDGSKFTEKFSQHRSRDTPRHISMRMHIS